MLERLFVKNFALVRSLELDFKEGFTVLTGETGAGKSLLIGALSLLLGNKVDASLLSSKEDETVIEGTFSFTNENDKSKEEGNFLILRRKVDKKGRNWAFINNEQVSIQALKSAAKEVIEINGQHQSSHLLDDFNHIKLLDSIDSLRSLSDDVSIVAKEIKEEMRILKLLEGKSEELKKRIENLEFDINEIEKINPEENEDEELKGKKYALENRAKIVENLNGILKGLNSDDYSVLKLLNDVMKCSKELSEIKSEWRLFSKEIESVRTTLSEIAASAEREIENFNFSEDDLNKVLERLYEIERLQRKYGPTLDDALLHYEKCKEELKNLQGKDFDKGKLKERIEEKFKNYIEKGRRLSELRRRESTILSERVEKILKELAIEKGKFEVQFIDLNIKDFEDVNESGLEGCRFLFSANEGEPLLPLSKIASGGELSRVMLAILCSISSDKKDRTLVFDEIDTGIGGKPAEKLGSYLSRLSKNGQIVCVTHLPQIAVYADNHIKVEKFSSEEKTSVSAKLLDDKERVKEIGRMVSGEKITDNAMTYAEELLKMANEKKGRKEKTIYKKPLD